MLYRTLNWTDDQTIFLVIVDWWQWPHQEPGKTHPWSAPYMNLFQFAYQPHLGADNAVIYLLNHVYAHLNQPARTVKVMFFFYFLSAFSTIRLTILCEKLTAMQVDASLVSWIADYLAEGSCVSSKLCLTRWSTTLGLFTLYTTDGRHCTETFRSFLMSLRWLNASVKVIHWRRVPGTRPHMDSFVMWCKQNYLELNITKTNELIVDFRRIMKPVTPVSIQGLHVDIVCINTLEYTLTIN